MSHYDDAASAIRQYGLAQGGHAEAHALLAVADELRGIREALTPPISAALPREREDGWAIGGVPASPDQIRTAHAEKIARELDEAQRPYKGVRIPGGLTYQDGLHDAYADAARIARETR